jgi:hemolysin-activating ACP:hemolysin acyltransferase
MVDSNDIIEIIKLYRKFSKYNSYTDREIAISIIPSLSLNQYKIFEDEYGDVYAFTNWAFLNKKVEERFLKTGVLENVDWQSGNICWHIDTINTTPNKIKEIYKYTANRLAADIGEDKYCNWIRINNLGTGIKRINKMKISTGLRKFN